MKPNLVLARLTILLQPIISTTGRWEHSPTLLSSDTFHLGNQSVPNRFSLRPDKAEFTSPLDHSKPQNLAKGITVDKRMFLHYIADTRSFHS